MVDSSATFESHRPALLALAYRILGEMARAEDVVQDAWVRWQGQVNVDSPKAFLLTTVARLCMDELGSARARRDLDGVHGPPTAPHARRARRPAAARRLR